MGVWHKSENDGSFDYCLIVWSMFSKIVTCSVGVNKFFPEATLFFMQIANRSGLFYRFFDVCLPIDIGNWIYFWSNWGSSLLSHKHKSLKFHISSIQLAWRQRAYYIFSPTFKSFWFWSPEKSRVDLPNLSTSTNLYAILWFGFVIEPLKDEAAHTQNPYVILIPY